MVVHMACHFRVSKATIDLLFTRAGVLAVSIDRRVERISCLTRDAIKHRNTSGGDTPSGFYHIVSEVGEAGVCGNQLVLGSHDVANELVQLVLRLNIGRHGSSILAKTASSG